MNSRLLLRIAAIGLFLCVLAFVAPAPVGHAATSVTVNSLADTTGTCATTGTGTCMLRDAITYANTHLGADTIQFSVSGTITLVSTLPTITDPQGVTIDGGGNITISGNHAVQVLNVASGAALTIQNLTIADGVSSTYNSGGGGGIYNAGTLMVTNSTFSGNAASWAAGNSGNGGAISNDGTLTVTNSTFSGNSVTSTFSGGGGNGGGIYNAGTLRVTNSTFSGNAANSGSGNGGGIYSAGSATVTNSTFTGNSGNGGGIYSAGSATVTNSTFSGHTGGGIVNFSYGTLTVTNSTFSNNVGVGINILSGLTTVTNSIVANNTGGNCNGTLGGSNNLADDATCGSGFSQSSSILLGTLGNYGGPTQTFPLLPGSAAIDAGNSSCPATDQRGLNRVGACDIGAFESQGFTLGYIAGSPQSAPINTPFNTPLGLAVTANNSSEPVDGGMLTFVAPATGASTSPAMNAVTIAGGSAWQAVTANGVVGGPYGVFVYMPGASNGVSFGLTNLPACSPLITVQYPPDSGPGSLREAITELCPGGTINFNSDFHIGLASELAIGKDLTITGANHSVFVGGSTVTFTRLFHVWSGNVSMDHLTIGFTNGDYGSGILNDGTLTVTNLTFTQNSAAFGGGGIFNDGTLTVTNSTFSSNSSASNFDGGGGGIYNAGTATVTNSTFIANSALSNVGGGGGILNARGALTVTNSTFIANSSTGNTASSGGGGIYVRNGTLTVTNSTFSGNSSPGSSSSLVGGIYNLIGTVTLTNSIIANSRGLNCYGTVVGSHNLADDASCGTSFAQSSSILLGTLGNYGGPTQTVPLLPGSAAIDAGNDATCAAAPVNNLDQRGVTRPQGAHCDIGAYESRGFTLTKSGGDNQSASINTAFANPLQVTISETGGNPLSGAVITFSAPTSGASATLSSGTGTTGSTGQVNITATANGTSGSYSVTASATGATSVNFNLTNTIPCSSTITVQNANDSGAGSLRQAIADLCPGGTINFGGDYTILLASELAIGKDLTITGASHNITVSGNIVTRVFNVQSGNVSLDHLTVTNGKTATYGGGINNSGTLTVTNSTLSGNSAGGGGGIASIGTLTVTNSILSGNSATNGGGGIFNNGALLTVTNSTFSSNSAPSDAGGGIYLLAGSATVTSSTFSGNSAASNGGGIVNGGSLTVTNSTFSSNSAANGGGIFNGGLLTLTNSTFSGNSATGNFGAGGGGINNAGTVTATNTIIANSPAGVVNSSAGGDCLPGGILHTGSMSGTNNLADDASCSTGFTQSSSILLGNLGDYGGPTQTFPLLPGSAAIDAGDNATCAAAPVNNLDQRGVSRPQGAACDIGAFESQGFTLGSLSGTPQSATVNTAFATPLGLTVTAKNVLEPVNGGVVNFAAPATGASTNPATSTATIASGGVSQSVTANDVVGGPYNLTASAAGAASINFSLTNLAAVTTPTLTINLPAGAVQSSDPFTLTASVTPLTAGGQTATGTVQFAINGTNVGSAVAIDATGTATLANIADTRKAGSYNVTATFTSSSAYFANASAGPVSLTIKQEDAFLMYSGGSIAQVGTNLNLRATVWDSAAAGFPGTNTGATNPDATIGDITKMWVEFDIYAAGSCSSGTPVATPRAQAVDTGTLGDGIGTATVSYGSASESSYCVIAKLVADSTGATPNLFYAAPDSQAAAIDFYVNSGQFANGGGWINDPNGSHGNLGFNARYSSTGAPKGQMVYVYRGLYNGTTADYILKSNSISGLMFSSGSYPISATLQGKATIQIVSEVDGTTLYSDGNATFTATVVDSGTTSGVGSDTFALTVYDKNGVIYKQVNTTYLQGGNIVVHNK